MPQRGTGIGLRVASWVLVPLGLVLMLGGIGYFFTHYQGVTVMSEAMEPTYRPGERLIIERIDAGEIRRGDVVLVHVPDRYQDRPVLQRVIGMGGDHVVCDGHRITVNGKPVDEPYVMRGEVNPANGPYDVQVPDGRLFLLGDHRGIRTTRGSSSTSSRAASLPPGCSGGCRKVLLCQRCRWRSGSSGSC